MFAVCLCRAHLTDYPGSEYDTNTYFVKTQIHDFLMIMTMTSGKMMSCPIRLVRTLCSIYKIFTKYACIPHNCQFWYTTTLFRPDKYEVCMHAYKTLTKCEYPENIQNVCIFTKYMASSSCKVVACFLWNMKMHLSYYGSNKNSNIEHQFELFCFWFGVVSAYWFGVNCEYIRPQKHPQLSDSPTIIIICLVI